MNPAESAGFAVADWLSAQARQMHTASRASSGTRATTSAGTSVLKHQQVDAPAAMPQSFGPPHSGHRRESTSIVFMQLLTDAVRPSELYITSGCRAGERAAAGLS